MQILKNARALGFQEFSEKFPSEAKILTQIHDLEALDFDIVVEENEKISIKFREFNPIWIDALNILKRHEVYFFKNSLYKDPLARAIGLKKGKIKPRVLDATAGMLGDTLLMLAYGIENLSCLERNPVVATLIVNCLKNSKLPVQFKHLSCMEADVFNHSDWNGANKKSSDEKSPFDVIFYDPMYKEKNTKASPKKEMMIFREIVGEDHDISEVANFLKLKANERLVIKRSNKAKPIIAAPDHSIKAKSTSYDVYLA